MPTGALSPIQDLINQACVLALTPFGLPSTILGLLGAAIPITLPNLPFAIIVTPISDLCLNLQSIVP
ncbi:MAG: hypothetical protein QOE63_525 [Acidimicrobiaceae bacterium]